LTAILYGTGHGGWWAWLLVLVATLHFYLANRSFRIAGNDLGRTARVH